MPISPRTVPLGPCLRLRHPPIELFRLDHDGVRLVHVREIELAEMDGTEPVIVDAIVALHGRLALPPREQRRCEHERIRLVHVRAVVGAGPIVRHTDIVQHATLYRQVPAFL